MQIFLPHGLMFCSVQSIVEVPDDPQAIANDFLVPFKHPFQGEVKIPGYPIHFSACAAGTKSAAPQLGEHTNEVLQDLGCSKEEIENLKKEGVIK